jgi:(E)-4-hydroxy-3-methylbut-2-enyl-diphosphate synthase
MKSTHTIIRRKSKQIFVGNVAIGGDAPISVQSMTNTDTNESFSYFFVFCF